VSDTGARGKIGLNAGATASGSWIQAVSWIRSKTALPEEGEPPAVASVLVGYASAYGSTQEVAEKVAERLRARGLEVDTRDVESVRSIDGYDAVVFGGALYYFWLIRKGARFVRRFRKALAARPLAVFGMGPLEEEEGQTESVREHLDKTLDKYPELAPVTVAWADTLPAALGLAS
jgi:menaquinone-dependent protoporphyrinogen oxidase